MTAPTGPTPPPPSPLSGPAAAAEAEATPARPPTPAELAVGALERTFGETGTIVETIVWRGETTIVVAKEPIVEVLRLLRDDPALRFDRLSDLTAVDYLDLEREPRFAVVYHLMSRSTLARLRVRAQVPEDDPFIDSVVGLFPSANWFEREVYDLFGIGFAGHPNLTRIMMPEDWDGHPLRKDFPIGAEAIDFSFNREGIAASHPGTLTEREERYKVDHHTLREAGDDPGGR